MVNSQIFQKTIARRNTVPKPFLTEWGLIKLVKPSVTEELTVPLNQLKILSFKRKRPMES